MKILINDVLLSNSAMCYCISHELRKIWAKFAIQIHHHLSSFLDGKQARLRPSSFRSRWRLILERSLNVLMLIQRSLLIFYILLSVLAEILRSLTSLSKLLSHYWQSSLKISPALLPVAEGQPLINLKNTEAISLEAISL